MSGIEFDGEQKSVLYSQFQESNKPPKMIKYMLDHKLVKNEKQAQIVLLAVVVVFLIVSFIIIRGTLTPPIIKSL